MSESGLSACTLSRARAASSSRFLETNLRSGGVGSHRAASNEETHQRGLSGTKKRPVKIMRTMARLSAIGIRYEKVEV